MASRIDWKLNKVIEIKSVRYVPGKYLNCILCNIA